MKTNRISGILSLVMFLGSHYQGGAAINVNYSAPVDDPNVTYDDLFVPNGNEVRVGWFDTSGGFDIAANGSNLSALQSHWNEFDSTSVTTLTGQAGRFAKVAGPLDGSTFQGNSIYLWILKTDDNAAPGGGNTVTHHGIFTSSDTNWVFPDNSATPPNNTADIFTSELFDGGGQALWGNFVAANSVSGDPHEFGSLQLAAVPEPGEWAVLAGAVLLGFAGVRRWRRTAADSVQ